MNTTSRLHALFLSIFIPAISVASALSVALAIGALPAMAGATPLPVSQSTVPPPVDHVALGRAMFVQSCTHCHGDDATGSGEDGDGPDLHGLRISNGRIATVVQHGIRGEMPSFARKFSTSDTEDLIAYLRTLR